MTITAPVKHSFGTILFPSYNYKVGPFFIGGRYYAVMLRNGAANQIDIVHSDDPFSGAASAWSSRLSNTGAATDFLSVAAVVGGDIIHIAAQSASELWYFQYDAVAGTWPAKEQVLTALAPPWPGVDIELRPSGVPYLHYSTTERVMGSDYGRTAVVHRTGGTWSAPIPVNNDGSTNNRYNPRISRHAAADELLLVYAAASNASAYTNILSPTNTLGSNNYTFLAAGAESARLSTFVERLDGGMAYGLYATDGTDGTKAIIKQQGDASQWTPKVSSRIAYRRGAGPYHYAVAMASPRDGPVYGLIVDNTDLNVYIHEKTASSITSWGAEELLYSGGNSHHVSANVYTLSSGDIVLGVLSGQDLDVSYSEKVLVSAGPSTVTGTVALSGNSTVSAVASAFAIHEATIGMGAASTATITPTVINAVISISWAQLSVPAGAGLGEKFGQIAAAGTGSLTAIVSLDQRASMTIASTASTLTVSFAEKFASVPTIGTSSLTAAGIAGAIATAHLSITARAQTTFRVDVDGYVSAQSIATAVFVPEVIAISEMSLTGVATSTVSSISDVTVSAGMVGVSNTSAAGYGTVFSGVAIDGSGSNLVVGFSEKFAAVSTSGIAYTNIPVLVTTGATLAAEVKAYTATAGYATTTAGTSAPATSALSATALRTVHAATSATGRGQASISANVTSTTTLNVSGEAHATIGTATTTTGIIAIHSTASNLTIAFAEKFGTVALQSDSTVAASAFASTTANLNVEATAQTDVGTLVSTDGNLSVSSTSDTSAASSVTSYATLGGQGVSIFGVDGSIDSLNDIDMSASSALTTTGSATTTAAVPIDGTGSTLTVAFAEKFAGISVTVHGTQGTDASVASQGALTALATGILDARAYAETTTSLTAHSDAFAQVEPSVEASDSPDMFGFAYTDATGSVNAPAATDMSAQSYASAVPSVETSAALSITSTASNLVVAFAEKFATVSTTSDATFSTQASITSVTGGVWTADSSLSTDGWQMSTSALSFEGVGTSLFVPEGTTLGRVSIVATGILSSDHSRTAFGALDATGTASTETASDVGTTGSLAVASTGSQLVVAEAEKFAQVVLTATSTMGVEVLAGSAAGVTFFAEAHQSAQGYATTTDTFSASADSTATIRGASETSAGLIVSADSSATFHGTRTISGEVITSGSATITFEGVQVLGAQVDIQATASSTVGSNVGHFVSIDIAGRGATLVISIGERLGRLSVQGRASVVIRGTTTAGGWIPMVATSAATVTGVRIVPAALATESTSDMSVVYWTYATGFIAMEADSTLVISPTMEYTMRLDARGFGHMTVYRPKSLPQLDSRSDIGTLIGASSEKKLSVSGTSKRTGIVISSTSDKRRGGIGT